MSLYPDTEPHATGMLPVSPADRIYWESCGNPAGEAALVLHGGPGSGCTRWHRRLFDPDRYRIVLFDQRNCGRSMPHASEDGIDLTCNTTHHLLADIESLRTRLDIDRCLVLGGSWGSALALEYAIQHPDRVSGMVLFGVTTGRPAEFDWLFRDGLRRFFPLQWERRGELVGMPGSADGVIEAYCRLLFDPDPDRRQLAASEWCRWESATLEWPPSDALAPRFRDPRYALAFARIVTHYVRHDGWFGEAGALAHPDRLADIPAVLINGRFDFQAPLATAVDVHRALPRSRLVIVDDAGHAASTEAITAAIVRATDRFAAEPLDGSCAER